MTSQIKLSQQIKQKLKKCLKVPADVSQRQKSPSKYSVILENYIVINSLFKCVKIHLSLTLEPLDQFSKFKMLYRSVFSFFKNHLCMPKTAADIVLKIQIPIKRAEKGYN